jgi:hypothetical protein
VTGVQLDLMPPWHLVTASGHYSVEYTPSSVVSSEDGQQTFLNPKDFRTQPLAEQAALVRLIPIAPPVRWTQFNASIVFRNLCHQFLDDEERAYTTLLERGCPLDHADAAWNRYTALCLSSTGNQS